MIIVGAFSYSNFMLFEHRQIIGEGTIHFCGLFWARKVQCVWGNDFSYDVTIIIFVVRYLLMDEKMPGTPINDFVNYARGKTLVFIPPPLPPPLLLLRFRLLAPGTRSSGTRCPPKIAMKDKFDI